MTRRLSFVAEITVVVDDVGTQQTFYFGTEGWATKSTDTPANTVIRGLLSDAGSYRQELFSGARVAGASRPSFGQLVVNNADGVLDDWLGYGVAAGRVVVRYGDIDDAYPAAWNTVYIAYAYALDVDFNEIRVQLRDRTWLLEKPVVSDIFGGVTGFDSSISTRKKQMVFGRPGYIPPVPAINNKHIYFVHANATSNLAYNPTAPDFTVFDGGVELDFGGYYETEADGLADAPSPGEFKVFSYGVDEFNGSTGPLYFRLGSPPEFDVRYTPHGLLKNEVGQVARLWTFVDLCNRAGLTDVTTGTLADGSAVKNVGNYLCDGDQTYVDVMDDTANAYFTPYGFNRLDQFFTFYLKLGTEGGDASVHTFTAHNARSFRRLPVPGMETPVWQVNVRAGRSFPGRVATSLTAQERDIFTRDVETVFTGSSQSALVANPGAEPAYVEITGKEFASEPSRKAFISRYFALYGARRDLLMVTARLDSDTIGIHLHDKVTVQMDRLGCDAGRLFRVITIELNLRSRTATFGLWGGDVGPSDWVLGGGSTVGGGSTDPQTTFNVIQMGDFTLHQYGSTSGGVVDSSVEMGEFTLASNVAVSEVDPLFGNVVLLLQNGDGVDYSSYGRTITSTQATFNSTEWQPEGLNSVKLIKPYDPFNLGGYLSWDSAADELDFGSGDFCIEGEFKLPAGLSSFYYYVDDVGGNSASLWFAPNGDTGKNQLKVNNGAITSLGPSMSLPQEAYVCVERVGSNLYVSVDGTVVDAKNIGSISLNVPTQPCLIGRPVGVGGYGGEWEVYVGRYRVTVGASRYGGASFTPPAGSFPTS